MDGSKAGTWTVDFPSLLEERPATPTSNPMVQTFKQPCRGCFGELSLGEFPLSDNPSIALVILNSCGLGPCDLARLEATSTFFKTPANFPPQKSLSLAELAALDMCNNRNMFKSMKTEEQNILKQKCGGSWKLVLKFLLAGEKACSRRGKSQVAAGCGYSVVVSSQGVVYTFGDNKLGQLGHGTFDDEPHPRRISSLEGIRVVQAVAMYGKTMLVSDRGHVYNFGTLTFCKPRNETKREERVSNIPQLIDPLKNIFVVQIAIGHFFTAVLSREGKVYTLCWGKENKLNHQMDPDDVEPHQLDGALENIPVVQISAGGCYLLALAFQPSGLSVFSVGCGLGGKLGHGTTEHEPKVRLVEHLQTLNIEPVIVAAGSWHIAVVSKDGRVCTWGWGNNGCLGHGNEDSISLPKVVEGLSHVKAVDVATGVYATFVMTDNGDVYSFGSNSFNNLGHGTDGEERQIQVLTPKIVTLFKQIMDQTVQISLTKNNRFPGHTLVLTDSGQIHALGRSKNGNTSMVPELVSEALNLSFG